MKSFTGRLAAALLVTASFVAASSANAQGLNPRTTPPGQVYGDLKVTVDGKEKTLAPKVWKYWLLNGGRTLLWAGSDGAGGYENEGQSLWRYDAATRKKTKLGAFLYMIHSVREAKSRSGKRAFVLTMFDGGLGAPHIAVVKEKGGIAWQHRMARLAAIRNGRIAVAVLREQDIHGRDDTSDIKPRRMVYLGLDSVLRR